MPQIHTYIQIWKGLRVTGWHDKKLSLPRCHSKNDWKPSNILRPSSAPRASVPWYTCIWQLTRHHDICTCPCMTTYAHLDMLTILMISHTPSWTLQGLGRLCQSPNSLQRMHTSTLCVRDTTKHDMPAWSTFNQSWSTHKAKQAQFANNSSKSTCDSSKSTCDNSYLLTTWSSKQAAVKQSF